MARVSRKTTAMAALAMLIMPLLSVVAVFTWLSASVVLMLYVAIRYVSWFVRVTRMRSRPWEMLATALGGFEVFVARLVGAWHDNVYVDTTADGRGGMGEVKLMRTVDDVPPPSYLESEWIENGRTRRTRKRRLEQGLATTP
ncbi:hypothetical protein V1512DRAFT_262133 [Lipomyces arxii]|uniref:uncharacterized protein n=1 Tax=Lipomyces arxii TaxID=56418 RepID=UPI0034CF0D58